MLVQCKLCGAEYDFCPHCARVQSWRRHTDTADHYAVWLALMAYRTDHDAQKAYGMLEKRGVDFQRTDGFLPGARQIMAEIYEKVQPKKETEIPAEDKLEAWWELPVEDDEPECAEIGAGEAEEDADTDIEDADAEYED